MHTSPAPHVPLAASADFAGRAPRCEELGLASGCGDYADMVEELDDSVGQMLARLDALGRRENTLVVFTSDNGPWLSEGVDGGWAGGLRGGKGMTFEGGLRVPAVASWPAHWPGGQVIETPTTALDWWPTLARAAGAPPPEELVLDGFDLDPLLRGAGPRDPSGAPFHYLSYRLDNETPGAIRVGDWKYKAPVEGGEAVYARYDHGGLLFDLAADPGEENDVAATEPERLAALMAEMERLDALYAASR